MKNSFLCSSKIRVTEESLRTSSRSLTFVRNRTRDGGEGNPPIILLVTGPFPITTVSGVSSKARSFSSSEGSVSMVILLLCVLPSCPSGGPRISGLRLSRVSEFCEVVSGPSVLEGKREKGHQSTFQAF